jgi:predicted DNA-binding transcriptional regulator AlpA
MTSASLHRPAMLRYYTFDVKVVLVARLARDSPAKIFPPHDGAKPDSAACARLSPKSMSTQKTKPNPGVSSCPLLVDAAGVGRLLGYSRSMVFQLHSRGRIPRPLRLSADPRWDTRELADWLSAGAPPREQWENLKASQR